VRAVQVVRHWSTSTGPFRRAQINYVLVGGINRQRGHSPRVRRGPPKWIWLPGSILLGPICVQALVASGPVPKSGIACSFVERPQTCASRNVSLRVRTLAGKILCPPAEEVRAFEFFLIFPVKRSALRRVLISRGRSARLFTGDALRCRRHGTHDH